MEINRQEQLAYPYTKHLPIDKMVWEKIMVMNTQELEIQLEKHWKNLISDIEAGYSGLAFASGMAAITAVLTLFKSGDKIILSDNVYGGTYRVLAKVFKNF